MPAADDHVKRLRAAIDHLAADDVPELLSQARSEARARVRAILAEAFADAMLEHVRARLGPAQRPVTAVPAAPPRDRHSAEKSAQQAWYVYGVIGKDDAPASPLPPGVESERPACTVSEGDLAAVASSVPLADFDEARLRAHLADMDWVERIARRHEEVLEEVAGQVTVIPMRMCTVYRDEAGLREMLRRESDAFREALQHLKGRAEWGVKVFADPAEVRAKIAARAGSADPGSSGTAYMQQRRRERDDAEEAAQLLEQSAAEIHESLRAVSVDGLALAPQRAEVSGHRGEMILNGVYLLDHDAVEMFHERVQTLRPEFEWCGIELQMTGPWPAYNFVPGAIGAAW